MRPEIRTEPRRSGPAAEPRGADPLHRPDGEPEYGVPPSRGASPGDMIATATLVGRRARAADAPLDPSARFAEVYEAHLQRLTRFAQLLAGNATVAEDLVHDVFADLWNRLVENPAYLREPSWPWLRTAVTHLASKRHRAAMHEMQRLARVYQPPRDDDEPWSHMTIDFNRAIAAMPPRMRAVVILTYIEDRSAKQVYEETGIKVRTVETHLRRARERLKNSLGIESRAQLTASIEEPHA
jgi:RNA polymerase sigma-70 factor, ECF subfamily